VDIVNANPQAHDCIQVRYGGSTRSDDLILNGGDYYALVSAAHGMDFGNGRSNVQHLSAETRRVRARFSYACNEGLVSLSFLSLDVRTAE
jgi:hypothetical protein